MRIAQIAPLLESVPPRLYGGTERIVSYLTEALVERGHKVTLFASGDSTTSGDLTSFREQALRLDPAPHKSILAAHLSMLHSIRQRVDDFDVLHFHIDLLPFPLFETVAHKTVTTLHGRQDKQDLAQVYRRWPGFPLVSISDNQRKPMPWANWLDTIHHGLPPGLCVPPARPTCDYLAFLGRLSREKRPDRAIEIARRVGMPLKIAAKVGAGDRRYFHETIEPFGLVMIEAMACGTPVVAWREGSVPEVIDDGISGRVVSGMDEAVAAVAEVRGYDRDRIRACFEQRFDASRMAARYEALYLRLTEEQPVLKKA